MAGAGVLSAELTILDGRRQSALVAAGGIGVLTAARVLPLLWRQGLNPVPPCPFRLVTGHPCPFCGATRSMCAMAYGDVPRALRLMPVGPLLFAGAVALTVAALVMLARGGRLALPLPPTARRAAIGAGLALLAVSWGLKWFWLGP